MSCLWPLCKKDSLNGLFCSKQCKNKYYVDKRRKKLKELAVQYKGGSCELCCYSACIQALEFHHRNADEKDFGIASAGTTRSWLSIQSELDKCIMLCANCHREVHAGIIVL